MTITVFCLALLLLIVSLLVSLAETALLSLTNSDVNEIRAGKSPSDQRVQKLLQRSDRLLAGLQIWDTLANTGIVILSVYAVQLLNLQLSPGGIVLTILVLAAIILVIGEIIPRLYGQNRPARQLKRLSVFLMLFEVMVRPLSALWTNSVRSIQVLRKNNNDVSLDDLSKALELTPDDRPEEKDMLEGIISLYSKTAAEIMTPRTDMADMDINTDFRKVVKYIIEVEYSRIPVFSGNQDDIRGVLYIKDLLPYLNQSDSFHWQKLVRPAFFVPETKKIDDLLEDFRRNKIHLAIVVDEYGGTSGIVTMEDILEEIVGEINDEYDDDDKKFVQLKDGAYIFDGKTLLTDFFRITGIHYKAFGKLTEEVDSLAGLVLEIKADFPELRETVTYETYSFQVLEMDKQRIGKIKFTDQTPPEKKE